MDRSQQYPPKDELIEFDATADFWQSLALTFLGVVFVVLCLCI